MIRLTIFIIFISLTSCVVSRKQAERKVSRLLEMYPGIIKKEIKVDTIIKTDSFNFEIPTSFPEDSLIALLDKYRQALADSTLNQDTVFIMQPQIIREKIIKKSNLQNRVLSYGRETLVSGADTIILAYSVSSQEKLKLRLISLKKEIHTTETKTAPPVIQTDWQFLKERWPAFLFIAILIFIIGLIIGARMRGK